MYKVANVVKVVDQGRSDRSGQSGHGLTTIWAKLTFDPQDFDLSYNVHVQ